MGRSRPPVALVWNQLHHRHVRQPPRRRETTRDDATDDDDMTPIKDNRDPLLTEYHDIIARMMVPVPEESRSLLKEYIKRFIGAGTKEEKYRDITTWQFFYEMILEADFPEDAATEYIAWFNAHYPLHDDTRALETSSQSGESSSLETSFESNSSTVRGEGAGSTPIRNLESITGSPDTLATSRTSSVSHQARFSMESNNTDTSTQPQTGDVSPSVRKLKSKASQIVSQNQTNKVSLRRTVSDVSIRSQVSLPRSSSGTSFGQQSCNSLMHGTWDGQVGQHQNSPPPIASGDSSGQNQNVDGTNQHPPGQDPPATNHRGQDPPMVGGSSIQNQSVAATPRNGQDRYVMGGSSVQHHNIAAAAAANQFIQERHVTGGSSVQRQNIAAAADQFIQDKQSLCVDLSLHIKLSLVEVRALPQQDPYCRCSPTPCSRPTCGGCGAKSWWLLRLVPLLSIWSASKGISAEENV